MSACPIPGARGSLKPEGTGSCGVLILGEASGLDELADGLPFRPHGQSGAVLERAIRRIGATREMFVLWNVLPCHPPGNFISPKWEAAAIEWGREQLEEQLERFKPRVILALGNTAVRATTGLTGRHLGVHHLSGYLLPPLHNHYPPIVAAFHPAYLRRGKMGYFSVLMRCLRLAMLVAREGRQPTPPPLDPAPPGYQLSPTEQEAKEFVRLVEDGEGWLAYDIETPYSTEEENAEEEAGAINSIQFSLSPNSGIFFPWREPFIEVARTILASSIKKAGWNNWRFDDPRLRENECTINGENHDLMWAWHSWQPDLPRGLQFAASMQGPSISSPTHSWPWPWKALDAQAPRFYGVVDCAVLSWMLTYQ